MKFIQIASNDNVCVALSFLNSGEVVTVNQKEITLKADIPNGHKFAIEDIEENSDIIKYATPIGVAKTKITVGEHIHTHNIRTKLSEKIEYTYTPKLTDLPKVTPKTFMGYDRGNGEVGIRNEVWVIPTVGCVNSVATKLVSDFTDIEGIDGVFAYTHPFGCSQMGDDHNTTRKLLASLAKHPNTGGVLVLGLGCENCTMEQFKAELCEYDKDRIKFLVCQDVEDEFLSGKQILNQLIKNAQKYKRSELPVSKLIVGMKCGGSDGLSGITANPTVGHFSDLLISQGGTTILTEVPEMFGAETMLMDRCETKEIYDKTVDMVQGFKDYYTRHNQVVYENPSPGNKDGGITTLEDKSCGCVQKGGSANVVDVLEYGDKVKRSGLNLLSGPGNDLVSTTALTASNAHIILFTTGRGTPFGAPAPTVKISTNNQLYKRKLNWIDFNAGTIVDGESIAECGEKLLDYVIEVASGKKTKNEENSFREISIFKDGVVL